MCATYAFNFICNHAHTDTRSANKNTLVTFAFRNGNCNFFAKFRIVDRRSVKTAHIDDLIQDVMITISRQIKNFTYQRDLGKFRNFLRKIIRARAMDMLRKIYRQELHLPELGLQEEAVLDDQYDQEWRDHVRKVSLLLLKQSVSPRHYQIFDFLDIQNRKVREIATLYNLPESTIYSIRNRTEEKLRLIIKEHKLY